VNWDHARIFLAVARSGQILASSRRLGLDHATISRRLSALEADLGCKLFERRTDGCILTSAGERLLPVMEQVESAMLQVQSDLAATEVELAGAVRVGAPDGLGVYFLATELAGLASRFPGLTVQLVPLPRTFSLSKREADIAITLERPTDGRLIVRKLTDYSLHVYASAAHLARNGPIATRADLRDRMLICYVQDLLYSQALNYGEVLEPFCRCRFECASVVGQFEAVRSGFGIAVLHDYAARRDPELVPVLPEIHFERTYWISTHPDVHKVRRVAEVVGLIVDRIAEARPSFLWDVPPAVVAPGAVRALRRRSSAG
jgi:DNA-binding transcriptional LysR family regulator